MTTTSKDKQDRSPAFPYHTMAPPPPTAPSAGRLSLVTALPHVSQPPASTEPLALTSGGLRSTLNPQPQSAFTCEGTGRGEAEGRHLDRLRRLSCPTVKHAQPRCRGLGSAPLRDGTGAPRAAALTPECREGRLSRVRVARHQNKGPTRALRASGSENGAASALSLGHASPERSACPGAQHAALLSDRHLAFPELSKSKTLNHLDFQD